MLRLIDGWDVVFGNDQVQLKYPQSYITFIQQGGIAAPAGPSGSAGPHDKGIFLFNTAFGEANFQRTFDSQPTWVYQTDFQMAGVGSGAPYPVMEWCRFLQGPKPSGVKLCSLTTTSTGQMTVKFFDGSPSENVVVTFTTTAVLTANTWANLKFKITLGPVSAFTLQFNGSTVLNQVGISLGGLYPQADTVCVMRWQGFGPPGVALDNTVIWDTQNNGDGFTDLMPPQRITTVIANADVAGGNWGPFLAAASLSSDAVNPTRFNTPMSDYDYATPNNVNALQLFLMETVPCYGQINALALNFALKAIPPVSTLPSITAVVRELTAPNSMGVLQALNLFPSNIASLVRGYWILQAIAPLSLQTGTGWKAGNLSNDAFGMIADPSNIAERVSAVSLEVLTDVSGLPFTCGGLSNYSY